ncbi:MAG: hypothetical protein EP343_14485 [Deltaproteobacteria bacterium]|nr:MAG: hypothetical protein EP343_14485 [Deltaproteobacteria bacterium]
MKGIMRSVGLLLFGIAMLGLWGQGCSQDPPKECTSNSDCASKNCDPGTFKCIGSGETGTTEASEEPGSQGTEPGPEPSTGPEPGAEPGAEPATNEPTSQPEPGPEPSQEPTVQPEAGPEPGPEPTQEASNPDGPVIQGPCQSSKPKCPNGYLCRDDVSPTQCHRVCDPDQTNSCPGGALCLVLLSGDGICVNGTPVKKREACDNSKICEQGLICLRSSSSSPNGTCETRCTLKNQSVCPSGTFCYLVHSRNGVCFKGQAGSKSPGEACKQTTECAAGLVCFTPTQQSPRCAALCDAQSPCPQGQRCAELQGAPENSGACVTN